MIKPFAMFPVFVARDLESLRHFYEKTFGFTVDFFQEDFYLHLSQAESGVQLAFMVPEHPSQPDFLHVEAATHGMVISLEVKSAQSAFESARESGLDFILDYKVEEFGVSHFMIKDPAGFVLDIVEHHDA